MTAHAQQLTLSPQDWRDYRANLPRHLIGLARYLQSRLMHSLIDEYGHSGLRLHFEPYIALAAPNGIPLGELADNLRVSRQAVSQVIKQIEAAGYLKRVPDPADGRSRRVVLTDRGEELVADGTRLLADVDSSFASIVGADTLERFTRGLYSLYCSAGFPLPPNASNEPALGWLLPRCSTQLMKALMDTTRQRGHPGLKISFAQVLPLIGPEGGRISDIARVNEISKQAVSAIAQELEALGYIYREPDPDDARQHKLQLTPQGAAMISDAVAATRSLEASFRASVGKKRLLELKDTASALYRGLALEAPLFGKELGEQPRDIEQLAKDLLNSLGATDARRLTQRLTALTEIPA
ncbi:MAG: MarR family transcriptional regulator [Halieaceae bacterium]|jgi:DNA-binding MarR family transcriptional regulator|nr:MarR family transcriptional regulator [Halieaceae bacterium]